MADIYEIFDKGLFRLNEQSTALGYSAEMDASQIQGIIAGGGNPGGETGIMTGTWNITSDFLQSINFVSGSTGWRLSANGNFEGNSGTFRGTITATSGTIGGWTISATALTSGSVIINSTNEQFLLGSATTPTVGTGIFLGKSGGVYQFRAGNPAGAYIHWDGSTLRYTGGVVASLATGSEIAIQGWVHTMVFSITDLDTVAWSSGTITLLTGTAYSISAGNTGNMAAQTFIYLDINASTTVLQTTTTKSTAVGTGKILVAVAQNGTVEPTFMVFGSNNLNIPGSSIVASSITANEITANTITATELSTALLYAGTITLDVNGAIKGGQTTYDTGTGFFLGYSGGAYKFSIGVGGSTTSSLTWDGTTLTVNGYVVAGKSAFGGDGSDGDVTISADTSLDFASANVLEKNYNNLTVNVTKTLSATNVPSTGGVMILKVKGNLTLNGTITMSGKGSSGGIGGTAATGAGPGGSGGDATIPYYTLTANGGIGTNGGGAANGNGGGGGGSGFKNAGSNATAGSGTQGSAGTAGAAITGYNLFFSQYPKAIFFAIGAGASGGAGGAFNGGTGAAGGAGGAGGGCLIIQVKGNITFGASSVINVAGVNGTVGASSGDRAGGGGGGGSGGLGLVYYNGTLTDSGVTKTVTAGTGASGGSGGGGNSGGTGGTGSVGEIFVAKNTSLV